MKGDGRRNSMRLAALLLVALAVVPAFGQVPNLRIKKQPIQIRIRHADPWAVKTLLEGGELRWPELSTILNLMGMGVGGNQGGQGAQGGPGGNQGGQAGGPGNGNANGNGGLFPDGKFIVNPGDNSLWFIPNN